MVRLATIGTSGVTENFLEAVKECEGICLQAVYSRSMEKAQAFAEKHGAEKTYDSLDALAGDPEIDAVYIASPNFMHCSQATMLMNAGKHVICEKALASNSREVAEMMETAEKNGVVFMEAVRPIYDPGLEVVKENLYKLGKIRGAKLWNGRYSSKYTAFRSGQDQNIFDRKCSAGGLMDMGVYCVHPMLYLFGIPSEIRSACVKIRGGIDGAGTILALYDDMLAEISYSKINNSEMLSEIQGEEGVMTISDMISPREVICHYNNGTKEVLPVENCENNMIFEVKAFVRAIEEGTDLTEYHRLSVLSMELMEKVRRQNEIVFPADRLD